MIKHRIAALSLCVLTAAAWAQNDDAPAPPAPASAEAEPAAPEQILVVGQRPGPGLWKVSKGDHVLWIFGTYGPLPKKMEWRSQQVEAILAQTQEVIWAPSANTNVGFFRSLTLLPRLIGVKKNPDGAKLQDVVPADVYARWLVLKEKYIGKNDDIERERPFFAAELLYTKGLFHAGLTSSREVYESIGKIVKKHNIKSTTTAVKFELKDPGQMLSDFKKGTLDDAACFAKTLDRLENDLDNMRLRANAWAKGDVAQIQKMNFSDREEACRDALFNSGAAKGQLSHEAIQTLMHDAWLAAVEKALASNTSTFSMLGMNQLLDPKGLLAKLEAKGYTVEKPE